LAGLLVAVKQIMPDHEVVLAGLIKLKARVSIAGQCQAASVPVLIMQMCDELEFV
jgi:hypothetical protein